MGLHAIVLMCCLQEPCLCGPDCVCGLDCRCCQFVAAKTEDKIERAERQAVREGKHVVIWVGPARDNFPDNLTNSVQVTVGAIDQREGHGTLTGYNRGGRIVEWRWTPGEYSAATAQTMLFTSKAVYDPPPAPPLLFFGGGCGMGGFFGGGCGMGGCGGGR